MGAFLACVVLGCLGVAGVVRSVQGKPVFGHTTMNWSALLADKTPQTRAITVALVVGVIVTLLTRWPAAGVLAFVVVLMWPKVARAGVIETQSVAKVEAIANWTESLRDAAASESGLEQALPATLDGAPAMLRRPLRHLINALELRTPLPVALMEFADDVDDRLADKVVLALAATAEQRSGSLKRVLTTLAANTRAQLEVDRKVLTERDGVRRQSKQVALGILLLAGAQALFFRGWVETYDTALGQVVVGILGVIYLGLLWRLQQLATPQAQPRILGAGNTFATAGAVR